MPFVNFAKILLISLTFAFSSTNSSLCLPNGKKNCGKCLAHPGTIPSFFCLFGLFLVEILLKESPSVCEHDETEDNVLLLGLSANFPGEFEANGGVAGGDAGRVPSKFVFALAFVDIFGLDGGDSRCFILKKSCCNCFCVSGFKNHCRNNSSALTFNKGVRVLIFPIIYAKLLPGNILLNSN